MTAGGALTGQATTARRRTTKAAAPPDLRATLRRPGDRLEASPIGTVPILWNNVDLADLRHGTDATTILDEMARLGFDGTQLGIGLPPAQRSAARSRRVGCGWPRSMPRSPRRSMARSPRPWRSAVSAWPC